MDNTDHVTPQPQGSPMPDRDVFYPPRPNLAQAVSDQNKQGYQTVKDRLNTENRDKDILSITEKYEDIRKLGFVGTKDMDKMIEERFAAKEAAMLGELRDTKAQMDALIADLQKIREFIFKPRNSGILDNQVQQPPERNPLLRWQ